MLTHFDHLGFEAPDGLSHLSAPGPNGSAGSLGTIEEILNCGADNLGSDVERPRRDHCLPGDPSAVGGRTRRAAGAFGERARERRGAADTTQRLCVPKRRNGAPIVVLDNYPPRVSADFGENIRCRLTDDRYRLICPISTVTLDIGCP